MTTLVRFMNVIHSGYLLCYRYDYERNCFQKLTSETFAYGFEIKSYKM